MNPRIAKKELGLLKGAIRRVFSRSELRRDILTWAKITHTDISRPRVTKWGSCEICKTPTPLYLMDIDHIQPVVPIDQTLETLIQTKGWDTLVNNIWCEARGLQALCKICHLNKTKQERKQRKEHKNGKSNQDVTRTSSASGEGDVSGSTKSRACAKRIQKAKR